METSPINPQIQALLAHMGDAPPLRSLPPVAARQFYLSMRRLAGEPEPVQKVENLSIPGPNQAISLRVYTPEGDEPLPLLVFFHGGGFVVGDLETHDQLCRLLANRAGCIVAAVDYHRAPEYKFPTAIEDAYAATQWLAEHAIEIGADATRIAVGGDSAGGNLAAVVTLMARDKGGPPLVYQVLIYPVLDATCSSASYQENSDGTLLDRETMRWFFNHYLTQETDLKNPYLSPLWAKSLKNLPPALVITAQYDLLRDEGEDYAQRLREDDVAVTHIRYDGMIHLFFHMTGVVDQARKAVEETSSILRAAFAK
jgi:acetyl esterase